MTRKELKQAVSERSRVMAIIRLTTRSDLVFCDTKRITGLDLQLHFKRETKPLPLAFGLLVRGAASATTIGNANAVLRPTVKSFRRLGEFTYPVCLFFFTMVDNKGYFSWLAEPILGDDGPELLHHEKASCVDFTDELLDEVVERVVAWYDAVASLRVA